jgi:hypothetical protein
LPDLSSWIEGKVHQYGVWLLLGYAKMDMFPRPIFCWRARWYRYAQHGNLVDLGWTVV